jgi:hypothetical protein
MWCRQLATGNMVQAIGYMQCGAGSLEHNFGYKDKSRSFVKDSTAI